MNPKRIVVCLLALLLGASVLLLVVSPVEAPSSPRDVVRFSLAFEDSPVPDMASYQALVLHGAGFEHNKSGGYGYDLYKWFARALQDNGLSMALTYRGYAQAQNRDASVEELLKSITNCFLKSGGKL